MSAMVLLPLCLGISQLVVGAARSNDEPNVPEDWSAASNRGDMLLARAFAPGYVAASRQPDWSDRYDLLF